MARYHLVPSVLVSCFSWFVILAEGLLAAMFLTGFNLEFATAATAILMGMFLLGVAINLQRGRQIDCGCFGAAETISYRVVARLCLVLAACLSLGLLLSTGAAQPVGILGIQPTPPGAHIAESIMVLAALLASSAWLLEAKRLSRLIRAGRAIR